MSSSMRSDSSASMQQTPLSPVPSSLDALRGNPTTISKNTDAVLKANGHASSSGQKMASFGVRARSHSLQKGAAVLRALARAPEGTGEEDSGYEDEAGEEHVGSVPGPVNGQITQEPEQRDRLTEEEKLSGRTNRDNLRQRQENKQVERMIGNRTNSNTSIDKTTGKRKDKKKKQVLITEKPRKVFHSSIGFLVLYLYVSHTDLSLIVRNLSIFLGIVVTADVLRLNIPAFEWLYEKVLGFLMRESEKEKVNGVVWYLIGVITSLSLFPADVACVSVMILSWADTAASVFGRLLGPKTRNLPSPPFASRKSTAGFMAAVIAASLTAALFWATPIAQIGKRPEGISLHDDFGSAIFGTSRASGTLGTGWTGFKWGFRPTHPDTWELAVAKHNIVASVKSSLKTAAGKALTKEKGVTPMPLPVLCLGSGLVAGIAEGLELGGVDDNLSLPILTAIGIHSLLVVWGWFAPQLVA